MKPTMREQLAIIEDRLNKALEHENWQTKEINSSRNQITERNQKIDELTRDKNWLKQLCQEQSAAIANYMRSRV